MTVSEICNREVVVVKRNDTALEAAKLMRQHHVGDVLVVEDRNHIRIPVGIVTDRDLIMEIMAPELDGTAITVGDIMAQELVTVKESMGRFEAMQYMRQKAVWRLPIVNESGGLIGILTLDDLWGLLSEELLESAELVRNEQQKETRNRRWSDLSLISVEKIVRTPLQITIRDVNHSEALETRIRNKAQKFEEFFKYIMSFHVVVEAPHKHHHQGKQFNVRIDIGVHGNEIVVNRDHHKDVYVALRDAFDAAKRQLEDYVYSGPLRQDNNASSLRG